MYNKEQVDLCRYRLEKAKDFLKDSKATLAMDMFDNAANRSYYAIFHTVRALLALDGKDFKKHSGVIACFQMDYIKTGIFEKNMSDIIKSAFALRQGSDYVDFYVISHDDVRKQVEEAEIFYNNVKAYIDKKLN